jgi:hypothetical protein
MKRTVIQIVLLLVIIVLAYLVYQSVNKPLQFNAEKTKGKPWLSRTLKTSEAVS